MIKRMWKREYSLNGKYFKLARPACRKHTHIAMDGNFNTRLKGGEVMRYIPNE